MQPPIPNNSSYKTTPNPIPQAIDSAFGSAEKYDHTLVQSWNTSIIVSPIHPFPPPKQPTTTNPTPPTNLAPTPTQNAILKDLIEKTKPTDENKTTPYKFVVTSTIIQHTAAPSEAATAGRRGMHSAVGAFWNSEKDGSWSYKWDGAEKKGLDSVISITWIAL